MQGVVGSNPRRGNIFLSFYFFMQKLNIVLTWKSVKPSLQFVLCSKLNQAFFMCD